MGRLAGQSLRGRAELLSVPRAHRQASGCEARRLIPGNAFPSMDPQPSIRVLHVSGGNLYGGVERIITSLATFRALRPSMDPVFGLAFDGRQADELRAAGTPPRLLGGARLSRPLSVLRSRQALGRVIDELRPDAVVCHNPWPLVVFGPVAKRRRIPLAVWVHGELRGDSVLERLARRVRPDIIIANSHFTASGADAVFPHVPRAVVYAPTRFHTPERAARSRVRAALGAGNGTVVILQASRIEPGKGHLAHVDALRSLGTNRDWRAWFAGGAQQPRERTLMEKLHARVAEQGIADRVQFLGERTDVDDLLAGADVFCQPNASPDAFGLSFVEALAAGVPVVTTRMGGAVEVVDESCGVLVPPNDSRALEQALSRLVDDAEYRRRLGAAGPPKARALCDPSVRMADLEAALRTAIARSGPRARNGS